MIRLAHNVRVEVNNLPVRNTGSAEPAFEYVQETPASTWTITHNLGRIPLVDIYINGEQVETDVESSSSVTTVSFPIPYAGSAVIF